MGLFFLTGVNMKFLLVFSTFIFSIYNLFSEIKDLPGGIGEIRNTERVGKYLLSESLDILHIYDLEKKNIVNTFRSEVEKYAVTEMFYFIIVEDTVKQFKTSNGELISKKLINEFVPNEYVRKLKSFIKSTFILETNLSLYLINEVDFKITKILDINRNDFRISNEGKGVFYSDGYIYFVDINLNIEKFKFTLEKDIFDFNFKNGKVYYNYVKNSAHYIESVNLGDNSKNKLETEFIYDIVIVGDNLITYEDISMTSLNINSLDFKKLFSINTTIRPFINDFQFIDDNHLVISNMKNGLSLLLDIEDSYFSPINYFNSAVEAMGTSDDQRYICTINDRNNIKNLQVIALEDQEVKKSFLFESNNNLESIYYSKPLGFVFQSSDREISRIKPEKSFQIEFDYKHNNDITSFNINEDYLFIGDKDGLKIIDLKTQDVIHNIPTTSAVNFINLNNNNCVFSSNLDDKYTLYSVDITDFDSNELETNSLMFYTGNNDFPLTGITETYFYQVQEGGNSISFFRLDEKKLGTNRSIGADNIKSMVAINDSIFICAFSNPQAIKKVKINYNKASIEILKDYEINIDSKTNEVGSQAFLPITKLNISGNLISYTTIVDNTIRFIVDDELLTSVESEKVESISDIDLKNLKYDAIKIYDYMGKEIKSIDYPQKLDLENLDVYGPLFFNIINNDNTKTYKYLNTK